MGVHHRIVLDFPAGYGFAGIAVALMGRSHPLGIVLAALLFGALQQGGAELAFEIPTITREMVVVIQGLIILFSGALAHLPRPWLQCAVSRRSGRLDRWTSARLSFVFLMLAATLRVATPLVLCAMGGLFSEKSGIIDVGLEGKMLMAAFFAAATVGGHRLGLGGRGRRHRRRRGDGAAAWLCLHHLSRQPGGERRRHQHPGGRSHRRAGHGLVRARRPDAGAGGRPAPDAALLPARRRQHPGLCRARSRCRSPGGSSSARALACGCAPWARCRSPSTPPASRWPGCAIARCCCAACSPAWPAPISRSPRMPVSAAT